MLLLRFLSLEKWSILGVSCGCGSNSRCIWIFQSVGDFTTWPQGRESAVWFQRQILGELLQIEKEVSDGRVHSEQLSSNKYDSSPLWGRSKHILWLYWIRWIKFIYPLGGTISQYPGNGHPESGWVIIANVFDSPPIPLHPLYLPPFFLLSSESLEHMRNILNLKRKKDIPC